MKARNWASISLVSIFLVVSLLIHPACACPSFYEQLAMIPIFAIICGERWYRLLGTAALVFAFYSIVLERRSFDEYSEKAIQATKMAEDAQIEDRKSR